MSAEDRATAVERIETLQRLLEAQPHEADLAPLIEECVHLVSAVRAFHMEAIRFRMYGLNHRLTRGASKAPAEALALLDEARAALESAGFKTK